jgi:hypothetical protein
MEIVVLGQSLQMLQVCPILLTQGCTLLMQSTEFWLDLLVKRARKVSSPFRRYSSTPRHERFAFRTGALPVLRADLRSPPRTRNLPELPLPLRIVLVL